MEFRTIWYNGSTFSMEETNLTLQPTNSSRVISPKEQAARAFYYSQIQKAKEQRRQVSEFFDDMSYEADYYYNRQAANSYLRKKLNDSDVRVNSGATEKKIEAMMNELLALNLQSEFRAFDEDDLEDVQLGQDFSDIVRRTNEIEKDDDFWPEAIQELLTQRAVFIEEITDERTVLRKRRSKGMKAPARTEIKRQIMRKRLIPGLQVFLGDITIPAYLFNDQPYIIKYSRMGWREAQSVYGHYANFKYVKPGMAMDNESDTKDLGTDFRLGLLQADEVEVIRYESCVDDEFQIIINGELMEEPGTPLPWEYYGYNTTMTILKPMARNFAYGKPPTASAKTLQALDNETIRNLIFKFRQALKPPMAINTPKNVYSRDIFDPGAMTFGLDGSKIKPLIDHQGVTQSEFEVYNLINSKIEEFIGVSRITQALPVGSRTSATEIVEMQKQAMKMIGLAVAAFMRMKRDTGFLRLYNVLQTYTKPIGGKLNPITGEVEEIYKKLTAKDSQFENGKTGRKIVTFTSKPLDDDEREAILQEELKSERIGKPVRFSYIIVEKLNNIIYSWYNTVNSQERKGSSLDKAMFTDQLTQAMTIQQASQGAKLINWDSIASKFERTWNVDDMFKEQAPQSVMGGEDIFAEPQMAGEEDMGAMQDIINQTGKMQNDSMSKLAQGAKDFQTQKPNINSLINAA